MDDLTDDDLHRRINELSHEEEQLYAEAGGGQGISAADRERLGEIAVELDRCYDLLNQREARRGAGEDPGEASVRPADIVESYEQ